LGGTPANAVHAPRVGIDQAGFLSGTTGGPGDFDQWAIGDQAQVLVDDCAFAGDSLRSFKAFRFLLSQPLRDRRFLGLQEV
jgi:hypothetical protein